MRVARADVRPRTCRRARRGGGRFNRIEGGRRTTRKHNVKGDAAPCRGALARHRASTRWSSHAARRSGDGQPDTEANRCAGEEVQPDRDERKL